MQLRTTIPYYNWTYINLVPYDQISNSTGMAYRLILAMLIVGFIAAMAFSRRLTRYILKDFDLLIQKMEFFSSTELKRCLRWRWTTVNGPMKSAGCTSILTPWPVVSSTWSRTIM
ncbi:MAG: hypothetical protein ACLR0U_01260 [Enterocloster clostridioformis]